MSDGTVTTELLLLLLQIYTGSANFTVSPVSVNATVGSTVTFSCRTEEADYYSWHFNGSSLPFEQRLHLLISSSQGLETLTIRSAPVLFNSTLIQCIAEYYNPTFIRTSEPALLLLQGRLGAVRNLSSSFGADEGTLSLHWTAPLSLDNVDDIITYCIEIANSSSQLLLVSQCGVNQTAYYCSLHPSPCDTYTAVVTPVNALGNGTVSELYSESFYPAPNDFTKGTVQAEVMFASLDEIKILMHNFNFGHVCECTASTSYQDSTLEIPTQDLTCNQTHIILSQQQQQQHGMRPILLLDEHYTLSINLSNSAGSAHFSVNLSTYDVQSVSVASSTAAGELTVNATFATNTYAKGCLLILSRGHYRVYYALEKERDDIMLMTVLNSLPKGPYMIQAYDIESNGLPNAHPRPAFVNMAEIKKGTAFGEVLSSSSIDISPGNRSCCITCLVAITSDALGCVVVMVPLITNQVLVTIVGREEMQPHCVEVETAGNYSVAVFEWRPNGHIGSRPVEVATVDIQSSMLAPAPQPPTGEQSITTTAVAAVLSVLAVVVCLSCIIVTCGIHYRSHGCAKSKNKIEVGTSNTDSKGSEEVTANPAYGYCGGSDAIYESII